MRSASGSRSFNESYVFRKESKKKKEKKKRYAIKGYGIPSLGVPLQIDLVPTHQLSP